MVDTAQTPTYSHRNAEVQSPKNARKLDKFLPKIRENKSR